jgi:hypothetical protein
MTTKKIVIPKPCNQNWNDMTKVKNGAYCDICSTVVIDFTLMTEYEVKNYLLTHKQENICGRLKPTQIQKNYTRLQKYLIDTYNYFESKAIPTTLKFTLLFFITCILTVTGCEDNTVGKMAVPNDTINNQEKSSSLNSGLDTIRHNTNSQKDTLVKTKDTK